MQWKDRIANALEGNYKTACILCDRMENLENRLSEALSQGDGAAFSLQRAGKITVSEESRQMLRQEGTEICRRMIGKLESESAKLFDRLSAKDCVATTTF